MNKKKIWVLSAVGFIILLFHSFGFIYSPKDAGDIFYINKEYYGDSFYQVAYNKAISLIKRDYEFTVKKNYSSSRFKKIKTIYTIENNIIVKQFTMVNSIPIDTTTNWNPSYTLIAGLMELCQLDVSVLSLKMQIAEQELQRKELIKNIPGYPANLADYSLVYPNPHCKIKAQVCRIEDSGSLDLIIRLE